MEKILIFEVIVHKLKDWFMEQNNIHDLNEFNKVNDFSILKLIKLHFFVTAINSNEDDTLINKFDFFAMPYGPVETNIYNKIKQDNKFSNFSINNFKAIFINENKLEVDLAINEAIDKSISKIKKINPYFINADAGSLVELTHKWESWRIIYGEAKKISTYSKEIPKDLIKKDNKILNLELVY